MISTVTTPEEYLDALPPERKPAVTRLREVIVENLPQGFAEGMSHGMLGYAVPHSVYPAGYHTNPKQPLPRKKILLPFITSGFTPCRSCSNGFRTNTRSTAKRSWTWAKAAFDLKSWMIFLTSLLVN